MRLVVSQVMTTSSSPSSRRISRKCEIKLENPNLLICESDTTVLIDLMLLFAFIRPFNTLKRFIWRVLSIFTSAGERGSALSCSFQPAGPWHQEKRSHWRDQLSFPKIFSC